MVGGGGGDMAEMVVGGGGGHIVPLLVNRLVEEGLPGNRDNERLKEH